MENFLLEICENCGLTYGAHSATTYVSEHYKMVVPRNYCPGAQGRMDWDKSPGTRFAHSGLYEDVPYGTPAKRKGE